ncbi:MAG: [FeFe] hydrogenase H-cluster maturation GTPase HydF [Syntrophomonadaceae bacterium]|nr:[FeFe] hydrogenase H-cluster maturation GTPase HydF [Syntrophomonadaceae bacterium]
MSNLNETPKGMRTVIAVLGRRNAGKSSLINALVGFDLAIVSDIPGTTADPVEKAVEINPLGPCLIIDTAGIDDDSELGQIRIQKSHAVLEKADIGLIVIGDGKWTDYEEALSAELKANHKPVIIVINKNDLSTSLDLQQLLTDKGFDYILTSAADKSGITQLKERLGSIEGAGRLEEPALLKGIIKPGGLAVLVVPIDSGAPKGRLILPQVQTIRDILDNNASALVVKQDQLADTLHRLSSPPDLVITDSQIVLTVSEIVAGTVPLTTFSILFSRFKGDLFKMTAAAAAIDSLQDGDKILIAEACTHHAMSDDIGRTKIPRWITQYTGKNMDFEICSGPDFPDNLNHYQLIIQCGGCTITRRNYLNRIERATQAGIPITNYGIAISYVQGVLSRSLSPFADLLA